MEEVKKTDPAKLVPGKPKTSASGGVVSRLQDASYISGQTNRGRRRHGRPKRRIHEDS